MGEDTGAHNCIHRCKRTAKVHLPSGNERGKVLLEVLHIFEEADRKTLVFIYLFYFFFSSLNSFSPSISRTLGVSTVPYIDFKNMRAVVVYTVANGIATAIHRAPAGACPLS